MSTRPGTGAGPSTPKRPAKPGFRWMQTSKPGQWSEEPIPGARVVSRQPITAELLLDLFGKVTTDQAGGGHE